MIKTHIKLGSLVIGSILGVIFGGYLIISFMFWVFSDPFNFIEDIESVPFPPTASEVRDSQTFKDFQACRDKGGIPISSLWDGRLKRCDFNLVK